MKVKLIAAVAAAVLSAPAFATPVLVDFEGVSSDAPVGSLYQNLGVTFGPDALGFQSSDGFFSNAPSPLGAVGVVGTDAAMSATTNYSFTGGVSFFYSSPFATTVSVYDGLNGTGNVLASVDLTANAQNGGCSDTPFC